MVLKGSLHHHYVGHSKLVGQKQPRKALVYSLFLLGISDYKRLYISVYFITTKLPHGAYIKVGHDMNFLTLALYTTLD